MKKIIYIFVAGVIVAGGYYFWRTQLSPSDAWVQDEATGVWARRGSPQGVPPRAVIQDCYTRSLRTAYDDALQTCLTKLCASEPVCINTVMDVFGVLRGKEQTEPSVAPEGNAVFVEEPSLLPPTSTIDSALSPDTISGDVSELEGGESTSAPTTTPIVDDPNEQPAPDMPEVPSTITSTTRIRVTQPVSQNLLTSPFTIIGEAHTSVIALIVRVRGADGQVLIEEKVIPRAAAVDDWRPFKLTLAYSFSRTKSGTIEVAPEEGGDLQSVAVPVEFK